MMGCGSSPDVWVVKLARAGRAIARAADGGEGHKRLKEVGLHDRSDRFIQDIEDYAPDQ